MSACLVEDQDNKKYIQVHTHTLEAQLFIMLQCRSLFFSSRNCEVVSQSIAVEFSGASFELCVSLFYDLLRPHLQQQMIVVVVVVLSPKMLNFGGCRR